MTAFGLFTALFAFMALSPKMSSSMAADCETDAVKADGTSESSPSAMT